MSWTTPRTWVGGELVDQTMFNSNVRDNENVLATSIDTATGKLAGTLKTFNEDISTVAFSATPTFDCSVANNFTITLTGNITAITVSNITAAKASPIVIRFLQDGTGGRTVAIPAGWKSSNSVAVSVATGANKATVITLWTPDGGTTVYASTFVVNA